MSGRGRGNGQGHGRGSSYIVSNHYHVTAYVDDLVIFSANEGILRGNVSSSEIQQPQREGSGPMVEPTAVTEPEPTTPSKQE